MNEKANILHESNEKKQKIRAGVMTGVIFSGVLLLCFFLIAFTIPDPPLGEQYVAVGFADLGSVADASGATESETPSEVVEEVIEEEVSAPSITDPVVTEEIVTQEISIPVQQTEVEEEKPKVEPEPVRVSAAANLIRSDAASGGGGSQGSSDGVGNQGDEDGKIDGSGVVSGDFGDASLNGGSLVNAPRLKEKPKKKGVVRINIIVDSNGKVLSAKFDGGLNSTLPDDEHIRLAREAAMSATFSPNESIPRRSGFITIRFELE
jgi:outer membrane biosynthesis protein TonB